MLKRLGLLFPSLRRLRDERNKYATLVDELTKEVSILRGNNPQPEGGLQNQLLMLKQEITNLSAQVGKFETDVRFCLEDVRREFFAFSSSRNELQKTYQINTDYPIAVKSDDHVYPRGTRNDNTRYPRFVHAAERVIGQNLRVMELGCAGGGLVLDFILAGHDAVGIEGSDYSAIWRRAEWATIPDRLFTADITKPFSIFVDNEPQRFDLITAWEVLEHIRDDDIDGLFVNIRQHLAKNGIFCGSVATFEDGDPISGAVYHVTVKPYDWWVKRITDAGFEIVEGLFSTADFPRGSGNPRACDWDANKDPHLGFHICFRIKHSASQ
jgi:hypothetical protein